MNTIEKIKIKASLAKIILDEKLNKIENDLNMEKISISECNDKISLVVAVYQTKMMKYKNLALNIVEESQKKSEDLEIENLISLI